MDLCCREPDVRLGIGHAGGSPGRCVPVAALAVSAVVQGRQPEFRDATEEVHGVRAELAFTLRGWFVRIGRHGRGGAAAGAEGVGIIAARNRILAGTVGRHGGVPWSPDGGRLGVVMAMVAGLGLCRRTRCCTATAAPECPAIARL